MNKRSMKKGFPVRLLALLLCCFCLLSAIPTQVLATEGVTPPAQEEAAPVPGGDENATASQNLTTGEAPKTEAPKTEEPKTEEPKTEEPKTEEPKTEEPKTEEPKTEAPKTEEPKTEEPKTEAPKTEEPKTEEPEVEEPTLSLYDRLMACQSVEEINAILDNLSEEENAEMDAFTEEQNAALAAHMEALGYYGISTLDERSVEIEQGESGSVTFNNVDLSKQTWTCTPEQTGITTTVEYSSIFFSSSSAVTIIVASNVPVGKYTLSTTVISSNIFGGTSSTKYEIQVTVTEATSTPTVTGEFVVTNLMDHTQVAYVDFKPSESSDYTLIPIANGGTVAESGSNGSGALVFFVKPEEGYLLTEFVRTDNIACDLYSTEVLASESNIQYFKNNSTAAQQLLNEAKDEKYMGYYAFTYQGNTDPYQVTYSTKAERPQMTVTAVANPSTNVKPGDTVTYTITITPGHTTTGLDTVTGVDIDSLTVNGNAEKYSEPVLNANGTYTVTVTHEVTNDDWNVGNVELIVNASVHYSNTIQVNDRNGVTSGLPTTANVPNTASVSVPVAPKTSVKYFVSYDPTNLTPPEIITTVPYDTQEYFAGDTVTLNATYGTASPATGEPAHEVDDPTNGGTWTFDGWYKDEALTQKANATETMVDDGLKFYGKWTFTKYPTKTLTVTKNITGNMQDPNKTFTFKIKTSKSITYNGTTDTEFTFILGKGGSQTFTIPVGTTVTVTEDPGTYTPSYSSEVNGTHVDEQDPRAYGTTFVMPEKDCTVTFTNDKTVKIETAVNMDFAPYVLLLTVAAFGALLLLRKRRVV